MGSFGKRYLWACAGAGTVTALWLGYQWYRWSTIDWDNQDGGM